MLFSKTCGAMMAEPTDSTTPPIELLDRAAEQPEIHVRRPANHRAPLNIGWLEMMS